MIFINDVEIFSEEYELTRKQSSERRGASFVRRLKLLIVGSGDTSFRASINGIWLGNAVFADAPFKVDMDGAVTCANISITGGSITGGSITIGTEAWHVDSSGNMWWGDYENFASALDKISGAGVWSRVRVSRTEIGVGYYYENTVNNVNNVGLDLVMGVGSLVYTNSLPSIRVIHSGSGRILQGTIEGAGGGILLSRSATAPGTEKLLQLLSSNAHGGTMFEISRNGLGVITAIEIIHDTSSNSVNTGIKMALSSGNPAICYAFRFDGSEIVNAPVGGSQDKKIRVNLGGTDYYIPCNTA